MMIDIRMFCPLLMPYTDVDDEENHLQDVLHLAHTYNHDVDDDEDDENHLQDVLPLAHPRGGARL